MPEFSADPNTRAHFRNTPTVPLRDAYYPPQLPAVGAPGSQGGRGIGLNDVSD